MEEMITYLAAGDKLIKNEEGFFIHYEGQEERTKISNERGIELLFETNDMLRAALDHHLEE